LTTFIQRDKDRTAMFLKILPLIAHYSPVWLINTILAIRSSKVDRKRLADCKQWFRCAQIIAEKTDHAHAKEVLDFLRRKTFPATPINNGLVAIRCHNQMKVPLVILQPEDSVLECELWKRQFDMNDESLANYMLIKRTRFEAICLKGHIDLSDFSKGLLYLHEGKHAWHGKSRDLIIEQSSENKIEEELSVMEFECQIFKLYFGEAFISFIESEGKRIRNLGAKFEHNTIINQEWFDDSIDLFSSQFQAPLGEYDRGFLRYGIGFCIIFHLIEKYGKGDLREIKSHFLTRNKQSKH
jgi:hypothetical protein